VTKTVAVLCAAMLALTACGGGDDEEARENIKASLLDQGADLAGTEVTDEQAGCVSDGMVDEVGVDKLQEYKLLDDELRIRDDAEPTDMEKDDAEALAAVFVDCIDMEKMFEEQFASGPAADQLTDEQRDCLADAIDGDVIEKALADTFQGKEADPAAELQGDIMACVTGGTSGGEDMELPEEEQ
jgi:hypothetical protein